MLTHNAGMTVNNGFYQLASGTLGASIDATGFSVIVVNGGQVMLDGTLDVLLDPNFNPTIGSFYKFLLFQPGELSGTFASIQNRLLQRDREVDLDLRQRGRLCRTGGRPSTRAV